jgi:hypothetical protein
MLKCGSTPTYVIRWHDNGFRMDVPANGKDQESKNYQCLKNVSHSLELLLPVASMIEPGAPVQFLDSTLGAIEIGVLISSLLYGLNCGQVYTYAISPRPRSALMTAVVASVTYVQITYSPSYMT